MNEFCSPLCDWGKCSDMLCVREIVCSIESHNINHSNLKFHFQYKLHKFQSCMNNLSYCSRLQNPLGKHKITNQWSKLVKPSIHTLCFQAGRLLEVSRKPVPCALLGHMETWPTVTDFWFGNVVLVQRQLESEVLLWSIPRFRKRLWTSTHYVRADLFGTSHTVSALHWQALLQLNQWSYQLHTCHVSLLWVTLIVMSCAACNCCFLLH